MTELERYEGRQIVTRNDLRNATTDSWTEVLEDVGVLASRIAGTDFVPESFRGSVPAVAATILTGRELGFPPMTALGSLHSIKGRVGLSSEAMRALVLQAGHEIIVTESTSQKCTMKGRRAGSEEWSAVTWTLADARQAKLGGSGWTNYPRQMLQARASSELCRLLFPDVIRGLASTEEIDSYDVLPGAPAAHVQESAEGDAPVKRAPRKRAPVKKATAPAPDLPDGEAPQSDPGSDDAPDLPEPSSPDDSPDETAASAPSDGDLSVGRDAGEAVPPGDEAPPLEEEVVDAEIVGDDEEEEPVRAEPTPMISPGQRSLMIVQFNRLDFREREERIGLIRQLIGRNIESSNNVTAAEASAVIEVLQKCKDADALADVIKAAGEWATGDGA